ncbi:TPA: hypothetical protein ACTW3A_001585 [Klebsiella quasipneumoniae subsp. quasipneumoniae]|nr:hypothetical protein [Klebsiella quasipneumoniae subsp. quasipneumoniae]HBU5901266.1 hypothetical protein [Klebsiella quasipneumoniae subsp. quasipneumoniae]HBZ0086982.1 hypothetical protein [Klebsiella pneumoniae]HCB0902389.1 hypothetical protein [Klebsiella pneumoniae]HCB0934409.1 hypothetical protein [Klebsiella pneumoniae]
MLNEQIAQLVIWVGVIMVIPAFYRFCYAATALLWRRLFPVKDLEIHYKDESGQIENIIKIRLPKDKRKTLVSLIDDAVKEGHSSHG